MNDYLIGFLAFPALVIGSFLAYCACRWTALAASKAAVVLWTIARPEWAPNKRANFSALCYGAERGWLLVVGDLGFAVFVGQDHEQRKVALDRLVEKRQVKLAPKWANRNDAS